ncbi:ribosome small subunit-dependent GTPase A [Anaeromicropila populeti]|uniref:Small ribosomal subunit biogenesis GTPase RsgA n=1 Tax=Anaeromicropila populeti TaxID=37658 RepID=A0A1I6KWS7_9FIRM|nr:ribosome small subunit-dependent GTPase A [Anaeromicropila populeti]SFR95637.1 ribosome biogenesis GTPase [Anaeromicropila populeti]
MTGKIIKGIAGFYYIHTSEDRVYECKAKGIFRNRKIKPLVGDNVEIDVVDEGNRIGNIIDVLERKNELIRPAVANVDQAMVIFAASQPEPNFNLLDRFLIMMSRQKVPCIICFNKSDIVDGEELKLLEETYWKCGFDIVFISALTGEGFDQIKQRIENKTTVLAGPSGVGKSTLINLIKPEANMETGEISRKIERGRHTTRHSELFHVSGSTYIMDTPGFTSLYIDNMEKEELRNYFVEFDEFEPYCKFNGCAHINEPGCGVKEALEQGHISKIRYDNYVFLYNELKDKKKY